MTDPSGNTKKKLLTQIEQLKSKSSGAQNQSSKSASNAESSDVMYELMMKPDSSKLEERQKIAVFENRLEALEKVLGPSQEKMVIFFLRKFNIHGGSE